MINVLFVCLGNICRSPMAEAIFKQLILDEGVASKFFVDSAGLGSWHIGNPPHHGTRNILSEHNISYEGITARQFNKEDLNDFQYIIAMDTENIKGIKQFVSKGNTSFVGKMLDFVPEYELKDVPDPYYTGNFEEVYEMLTAGCRALLDYIKESENINA